MNLKQMKYFVTIADEGSISAAARVLHISQPPLSQQLQALEAEFHTRLFVRGSRSMMLTDAGHLFYQHAQKILDLSERAAKDLQEFENENRGSLRIGMIASSEVPYVLEKMLPFRTLYPCIDFRIYEGNTYQLLDWMKEDKIELAFVRTPFADETYECGFLEEETMAAIGKGQFFQSRERGEITMAELAEMPLIVYRRWETILNHSFQAAGVSVPEYYCICDDARTSLAWASCGFGAAIAPASVCEAARSEGMVVKPLADAQIKTRITLIQKKGAQLSSAAEKFKKYFWGII